MAANYSHVTLVVDPTFGERARAQAKIGPLWVIDSPENVTVIKDLWANDECPFADAPNHFDGHLYRSREDAAYWLIGTVDEHHPDWETFEIVGTAQSDRLLEALHGCGGSGSVQETPSGLIFSRALKAPDGKS